MGAIGQEELAQWERMQEASANGSGERILVSVRLRPLSEKELARNEVVDWECINENTIIFRNSLAERSMAPTAYTFDRVFRSDSPTKQVYEDAAKKVALSVVSGINASIFAYGQTSSGKTYTMNGITEYTVADVYDYINRHEERAFVLKFSAIEIYNEAVRDLLSTDGTPLRIRDDPERGPVVEKLTEEVLRDWNHMQQLLSICEAQRQVGETTLNEASSRSHQILRLTIESSAREFLGKDNSSTLSASVNFVDLAGSERASQALSAGARLKEGCHINRSLLTLGTVIRKLSKGRNGHIPYRDSKLTRILQTCLGGNARTAIICTMSPARSHVEQSRNTLLFATCAKEVLTSARVNVVMSDKALVKHLQKELARLESALRGPGTTSVPSYSEALLREKEVKIRKMEKEIKDLIRERDHAQSRLEVLIRFVGEEQASKLWAQFSSASAALNSCEDKVSVSESSAFTDLDSGFTKSNIFQYSEDSSPDYRERYAQLSEIPEGQVQSGNTSPQLSPTSSRFIGLGPGQYSDNISHDIDDDPEDLCKEVRCIEMDETITSRNGESSALSTQGNERRLPWIVNSNAHSTDEELSSTAGAPRELRLVGTGIPYIELEQQFQQMQRAMGNSYEDGSSPKLLSSSRSFHLPRSRSCRASLMTSSSSKRFQEADQNGYTPPSLYDKQFPRKYDGFQRRPFALKYDAEETSSQEDCRNSICSSATDMLKMDKPSTDENITSIDSFVKGLKEMAKLQHQKQLVNGQEAEPLANEDFRSEKALKDVGLDPMQNPLESPSCWPLEFQRQQKEIIELWHACNVSLVHRTYFFLLFKGDPADSIYMEVELRRLSFLRNLFSQGNLGKTLRENGRAVTVASSMKALRKEREMLSKKMRKSFSTAQRDELYRRWGIGLNTKRRRLQLVNLLWSETRDMDHISRSASIIAKVIGFVQPGQATKEMFGLSFTPQRTGHKSYMRASVPLTL